MPAIVTHDLFGRAVADDVADLMNFRSVDERDAYLLGNQGPDPLFYLVAHPLMAKWSKLGNTMHDASPAPLLVAMREAADQLEGRERGIARAYVAGFTSHWALDSTMHPFVYYWQNGLTRAGVPGLDASDAQKVHAEIERDWDEMALFRLTGKTVAEWRPYREVLVASPEVLSCVDKIYFYVALWVFGQPVDPQAFSVSVHEFRLLQRLFYSAGGGKRLALGGVERLFTRGRYSLYRAMSHRVRRQDTSDFDNRVHAAWENPFTGVVSHTDFWELFEGAQARILPLIDEIVISGADIDAVRGLTGDLNFEGNPMAPTEAAR